MMARFCRYADKVFQFGQEIQALSDARQRPRISTAAIFASAWTLFATARGSLNRLEKEVRIPARLQGLVGPQPPSADTIVRVYALWDSQQPRQMLCTINHQVRRNKAAPAQRFPAPKPPKKTAKVAFDAPASEPEEPRTFRLGLDASF